MERKIDICTQLECSSIRDLSNSIGELSNSIKERSIKWESFPIQL